MLNEDRIKLMTKMAAYEAKEGKTTFKIGKYFQGDYISYQMVKSAISITIAYVLMVSLWVLAKIEYLLNSFQTENLIELGRNLVILYIFLLTAYLIIAFNVYYFRYRNAVHSLKRYNGRLKQLDILYENEQKISDSQESLRGESDDGNIIGN